MHNDFKHFMQEATRLTQSGNLQAATAAIQAALGGGGATAAAAATAPDTIDVEARELPSARAGSQFVAGSFATASDRRDYKLFIPAGFAGKALPLVVMLHGCTQTPDDFAAGTAMNELAQAQGFLVLYPAQSQQANPQRCWNWFKHSHQQRGRGEPALLAGMTRQVMEQHAVDPARVYVAGLSAGGAMAAILGDTYPDLYAAVGVHSGLAAGAASDLPSALQAMQGQGGRGKASAQHVPTIVFHGDADATVHPRNGEHVAAASSSGAGGAEVQQHQPSGRRRSTRSVHRDAGGKVLAEHWLVHGAAHAWSGGNARGSYTDAQGPDASAEMLRFFLEHPRRAA
jgi:poly(hydroxyalkanoate) depolymerase family esterase